VSRCLVVRFDPDLGSPILLTAERFSVTGYRLALGACWLPVPAFSALRQGAFSSRVRRSRWKAVAWIAVLLLGASLPLGWSYVHPRTLEEQVQARAEEGDPAAMFQLGVLYQLQPHPSYRRARQWYEKAAGAGSPEAMNNLGYLYHHGQGIKTNLQTARIWYTRAASQGSKEAAENLRLVGEQEEFESLEHAADAGDANAMYTLGMRYLAGKAAVQNVKRGQMFLERAAARNLPRAMLALGVLYEKGNGIARNLAQAEYWYERAAAVGEVRAMINRGLLSQTGLGVTQDYEQAQQWYSAAATAGDPTAMFDLGLLYMNGQGVARDFRQARLLFQRAANIGSVRAWNAAQDEEARRYQTAAGLAIRCLGEMYHYGRGVPRDERKAAELFRKSSEFGCSGNIQTLAVPYTVSCAVAVAADAHPASGCVSQSIRLPE